MSMDWADDPASLGPPIQVGHKLYCFSCNVQVGVVDDTGRVSMNRGTSWATHGDYGSVVHDASGRLELYVCDVCLLRQCHHVHAVGKVQDLHHSRSMWAWAPASNWTQVEHLRVCRSPKGDFLVSGRLGEAEIYGAGPTMEAALRSVFERESAHIFDRDQWRRERPATFLATGDWLPRSSDEETRARYVVVGHEAGALGGGMVLRMEEDLGGRRYRVRVRAAGPLSRLAECARPGLEFKFGRGFGPEPWWGTGVFEPEREEDKW